ncbi:hypothetical protein [Bradyrhizobium sp. Ce-3]|uniref:FitA-like ribbon-helix-helix domain-containing protein n=1 Tax=Bradyrhizobium sp. Ce-3 TaxID=2913970 RepID=UPI0035CF09CF
MEVRAAQHNRSAKAETRAILETAVRPEGRLWLGTALSEMSPRSPPRAGPPCYRATRVRSMPPV